MTAWTHQPGHVIAAAVARGEVSARTVTEAHLARIAAKNPRWRAFTDITTERALAKADAVDAARARGEPAPPLAGVPFAAKNLFDIEGLVTRAGSRINRENAPAKRDASAIARLENHGAILVGALNMGEYAYDFTGQNVHDGNSLNPHDETRLSGGSSGGSGTAAAGGLAAVTLGSDTNGSIRVPASLCGLYGLKPTYGALTRAGTFPFVASLDHVGPLARSVRDLALAFDAMSGPDAADPACSSTGVAATATLLEASGFRVGVAGGYFMENATEDALEAVARVAAALSATPVTIAEAQRARAAAFTITMIEGAALHLDRLKARASEFDPAVRDRLLAGAMLPGVWYTQAQKFRRWFRDETLTQFASVDAILAPSTPLVAPRQTELTFTLNGVDLPVRPNLGLLTQPISFIGLPVVSVPLKAKGGLPIGVQILAAPGREDICLALAARLEREGITTSGVAEGSP